MDCEKSRRFDERLLSPWLYYIRIRVIQWKWPNQSGLKTADLLEVAGRVTHWSIPGNDRTSSE